MHQTQLCKKINYHVYSNDTILIIINLLMLPKSTAAFVNKNGESRTAIESLTFFSSFTVFFSPNKTFKGKRIHTSTGFHAIVGFSKSNQVELRREYHDTQIVGQVFLNTKNICFGLSVSSGAARDVTCVHVRTNDAPKFRRVYSELNIATLFPSHFLLPSHPLPNCFICEILLAVFHRPNHRGYT